MPNLALTLDDDGCPVDNAARSCLRALSQRGARLQVTANGASVTVERGGRWRTVAWLEAAIAAAMDSQGWLTQLEPGLLILAPNGRAVVRAMKAAPSPIDASRKPASSTTPSARPALVDRDSPLAWARRHRNKDGQPYLSQEAYEAGERIRQDFQQSGLMPRTTIDWAAVPRSKDEQRGARGVARDSGASSSAASERVRKAIKAVPPELTGLVLDVCCFELGVEETGRRHGMPQRSGHFLLNVALNALARHYGLLAEPETPWTYPNRTRHWAPSDYKPTIDGKGVATG